MLRASNLQKSFGKRSVVRGVSMQVERGNVVGLLGPNGAGKTTTLRMLYSLLPPDEGEIRIDGLDPTRNAMAIKRTLGVDGLFAQFLELAARLVDQPVIDPPPISIFKVRDKNANMPFFLCPVQRLIHLLVALAFVIKRRVPHIHFQRIPCLLSQHHCWCHHDKKYEGPYHPGAVFQPFSDPCLNDKKKTFHSR